MSQEILVILMLLAIVLSIAFLTTLIVGLIVKNHQVKKVGLIGLASSVALALLFFASSTAMTSTENENIEYTAGVRNNKAILDDHNWVNVKGSAPEEAKKIAVTYQGNEIIDVFKVKNGKFRIHNNGEGGPYKLTVYALKNKDVHIGDKISNFDILCKKSLKIPASNSINSQETKNDSSLAQISDALSDDRSDYNSNISYDEIARHPNQYIGKDVKFSGEVLQVQEDKDEIDLRIAIDGDYDHIILVMCAPENLKSRILENDQVTFYGRSAGTVSYEATSGQKITVPAAVSKIIDDAGEASDNY